jgi:hypothetical protein
MAMISGNQKKNKPVLVKSEPIWRGKFKKWNK